MVTYPIDWKKSSIGDLFNVSAGGDVKKQYFSKFCTSAYPYEIFSNSIENRGHYGYTALAVFPGNSVTVTARGTIGQAFYREAPYDAIIRLLVLSPKSENIKPKFYEYYINNQIVFERENTGVPQLTAPKIKEKTVPLFDGKEQEKIIETLQVFDIYIDDLAELIEKKKGIRDGALEDLMSGKTRIDGFRVEWAEYPFEVYFSTLPNNTFSRDKLSEHGEIGDIHYGDVLIKYGGVLTDDDSVPRIKDISQVKEKWYLRKHDVIIADTAEDETVGKVVQIGTVSIPLVGGLHTVVCRPNYDTAEGFLGYYMNSKLYHDQLYPYITGIKVSSISKKSFRETMLNIPVDVNEQAAIVSVLSAMDEEIRNLETERDTIIQIREGAMDDLLTGRVRLTK